MKLGNINASMSKPLVRGFAISAGHLRGQESTARPSTSHDGSIVVKQARSWRLCQQPEQEPNAVYQKEQTSNAG